MVVVRRSLSMLFALAVPVAVVALLYTASVCALPITNRTIDPDILRSSAVIGYAELLSPAIIEAKARR